MKLHFREIGKGKTLLILHGLYGASENWLSVAKSLSLKNRVILADHRNHGLSPHSNSHTYANICEDIKELLEDQNIQKCSIIAHSMGGKAGMLFACKYPKLVDQLIIIDIAPKNYAAFEYAEHLSQHSKILNIMEDIDLSHLKSYKELDINLDKYSLDRNEKQLIAKNIKKNKDKTFEWKLNIKAIKNNLMNILDFEISNTDKFTEKCYFLKGSESDYIKESDYVDIKKHFPNAEFHTIADCGHSPHRDQAERLTNILQLLLK
jgi:pimeloyl-ACP methyl ester carboxylesterase